MKFKFLLLLLISFNAVASSLDQIILSSWDSDPLIASQAQKIKAAELDKFARFLPNNPTVSFADSDNHSWRTYGVSLAVGIPGKAFALHEDGSVPKDNPYVNDKSAKPEVYARGIRSPQGLAMRPGTDELWESEMGPKGGDELNIVEPKMNFGWPVVTYGTEYEGPKIGEGTSKPGMQEPIIYWVPSISPSAMTFYSGDKMPEWKGNILLALLSGQHIRRLELNGKKIVKQEELFKNLDWRWRNIRTGPDGYLWFSTDEGKIGRVIKK